jgi:RNA polymerase sigma-70 factor (ECF subfamily)
VEEHFEGYRPLLFSIAYRMLGSAVEAEDVVQEAYLRYQAAQSQDIQSHKAFLTTIVTRLCLDQLKSAKARREVYPGTWLPEPILTDTTAFLMPEAHMTDYETISMAFLVLLESLTPVERAVFLLREVFDYEYIEIASIVGKEEAACRQLFHRAKHHITERRPRFHSTREEHQEILGRFMSAIQAGEVESLMTLLAENVTTWADAGGKVRGAALRPILGPNNVARHLFSLVSRAPQNTTSEIAEINGRSAIVVRIAGAVFAVFILEIGSGQIQNVRIIANPEKLTQL